MKLLFCFYVDDMLIMSKDIDDINDTKRMLSIKFNMKDLGVTDFILEVRIIKTPQGLSYLSLIILKKYWMVQVLEFQCCQNYN